MMTSSDHLIRCARVRFSQGLTNSEVGTSIFENNCRLYLIEFFRGLPNSLIPDYQIDSSLVRAQYKWWEEDELKDLCASVGLESFTRERSWRFIMFSARKPDFS